RGTPQAWSRSRARQADPDRRHPGCSRARHRSAPGTVVASASCRPGDSAMAYQQLTLERANQVATITLNRPDAFNAFGMTLGRELFDASLEVDEDPGVRCVVITGAGKAFCAGGDVKDFVENAGR